MVRLTIEVGEELLKREVLLLPVAYDRLIAIATKIMERSSTTANVELQSMVSSRWVLSSLTANLQHHITCSCKVRKYGTLLYRPNTDLRVELSQALWNVKSSPLRSQNTQEQRNEPDDQNKNNNKQVFDNLNAFTHKDSVGKRQGNSI